MRSRTHHKVYLALLGLLALGLGVFIYAIPKDVPVPVNTFEEGWEEGYHKGIEDSREIHFLEGYHKAQQDMEGEIKP